MPIRLSGMNSGLDTDAIVQELVKAKSTKKTTLEGEQKKLQWKQDAWKELNSKIYKLYSGKLSDMRFQSAFTKKATKASSSAVTVVTGGSAPAAIQTMKVNKMAKAAYMTGGRVDTAGTAVKASDKVCEALSIAADSEISITTGKDGNTTTKSIKITADMTMSGLAAKIKEAGVSCNFDEKNQRFYISANNTGDAGNFTFSGDAVSALGLEKQVKDEDGNVISGTASYITGSDASITLNGVDYESDTNSFSVNGLTITVEHESDEEITLNTTVDTSGIYDMVKDFLKEYNDLMKEMDKLYNAASAKDYKMLTSEEKEEMSEDEIKEWEDKIKASLLRRDGTLSSVSEAMKTIMLKGVEMADGTKAYLSDFGIATAGYFSAAENERNIYHIDGDKDDETSAGNADKLAAMIASDPDKVAEFFSSLSKNLYSELDKLMARTDYSSAFTVYNDKQMKSDYDGYTKKIAEQQEKITTWEDFYYKKFTRMEKAMAELQSKQNALGGLFGGGA